MRGLLGPSVVRVLGGGREKLGSPAVQDAVSGTDIGVEPEPMRRGRRWGMPEQRGKDGAHAAPPLPSSTCGSWLCLEGENVQEKSKEGDLFLSFFLDKE